MTDIWQGCKGEKWIDALQTTAFRIVESQEQIATTSLVDTAEEQVLLEQILERSKPAALPDEEKYHYLISTPFRYPPLPYGSRFGVRSSRGIFYGSLALETTLAECAYYRFVFWSGMSVPPPSERIITEHTTFAVKIASTRAVTLEQPPFDQFSQAISDPQSYSDSQILGERMRSADVQAFTYCSARDRQEGINIGLFTIDAIKSKKPTRNQQWICTLNAEQVDFLKVHSRSKGHAFTRDQFMIDRELPSPAC